MLDAATREHLAGDLVGEATFRPYTLTIVGDAGRSRDQRIDTPAIRVGTQAGNDVVLDDKAVSRIHFEITGDAHGYRLRDLGSTNGTSVDAFRVRDIYLEDGSVIRAGDTRLTFRVLSSDVQLPLRADVRWGPLIGRSSVMRRLFERLERVSQSPATVLIEGETGTGKELVATAIHQCSPRASHPWVVFDCAAIPANLIEAELFGHERGAFTGASGDRAGALEEADGGTLFLDELGELPLELQSKLLRAIESREVRRLGGSSRRRRVDVRFVAATNRDLAEEVNRGAFRADLYYRLAVVRVVLPPLRERAEDLELLVQSFLADFEKDPARAKHWFDSLDAATWKRLRRHPWRGNVRELRNMVERAIALTWGQDEGSFPLAADTHRGVIPSAPTSDPTDEEERVEGFDQRFRIDFGGPFVEQKNAVIQAFEAAFIRGALQHNESKIARAAVSSGLDRTYFKRLMKKHDIRAK